MKKIKDNLYEFDPQIYPRLVWVCIGKDEPLKDMFDGVQPMDNYCDADVSKVYRKDIERGGFLIRFENLDAVRCGILTHEAGHAALEIFRYIGAEVDVNNQEPFTYLLGFIGKCIGLARDEFEKTIKDKEDKQ